jgi:hypothetical protein
MSNYNHGYLSGLLFCLLVTACSEENPTTPCQPTVLKSSFKVQELFNRYRSTDLYLDADTADLLSVIYLRSFSEDAESLIWYVADTLLHNTPGASNSSYESLPYAQPYPRPDTVSVSLTVKAKDKCTNKLIRDSLSKRKVLYRKNWNHYSVAGRYNGAISTQPTDSFTIDVFIDNNCAGAPSYACYFPIFLKNLPKGTDTESVLGDMPRNEGFYRAFLNRRAALKTDPSVKRYYRAYADFTKRNGTVSISMEESNTTTFSSFISYTFNGRKVGP